MPLSNKYRVVLWISILACLTTAFLFLSVDTPKNQISQISTSQAIIMDNPADTFDIPVAMPRADAILTYQDITELQHKADYLRMWRDQQDQGFASGFGSPWIKVGVISENDSDIDIFNRSRLSKRYYIGLPGYTLDSGVEFHARKGHYYLKYPVRETRAGGSWRYEIREVPFRYSYASYDQRWMNSEGDVLVPVTLSTYHIFYYGMWVITFLQLSIMAFVFLVVPADVLIRIARGKPFVEKNIRELHLMAWTVLLGLIVYALLRGVLYWAFHHYMTRELHVHVLSLFSWTDPVIVIGLFIIAKAFKRGHELQKDQDLTV